MVGVSTPILQRGFLTCHMGGVSTPVWSEGKPYMLHIMGVGLSVPFEEADFFSHTLYIMVRGKGCKKRQVSFSHTVHHW